MRAHEIAPRISVTNQLLADVARGANPLGNVAGRSDSAAFEAAMMVAQDGAPAPISHARKAATVSAQLEELIFRQLLEQLVPRGSGHLFGKGAAGDTWRGMLVEGLAKSFAGQERLGLSGLVEPAFARATTASSYQKV